MENQLSRFKVLSEDEWIDPAKSLCDHLHINYVKCSCGKAFQLTRCEWDKGKFWTDTHNVKGHLEANPEHYIKKRYFDCVDS